MSYYDQMCDVSVLIGKTLERVDKVDSEFINFYVAGTDEQYQMYYEPDCCAACWIEDVVGDLQDLVGSPIVMAECVTSGEDPEDLKQSPEEYRDSFTWTFYKLATTKGYVTIRWYGSSNGYYSETASFRKVS